MVMSRIILMFIDWSLITNRDTALINAVISDEVFDPHHLSVAYWTIKPFSSILDQSDCHSYSCV